MSLIQLKLSAALAILLLAALSGLIPFRKRIATQQGYHFTIGEALASGIFLGAGLMHMLAEANENFHQLGYHYPLAFLLAGATFLLLLLMEHAGMETRRENNVQAPFIALLALFMLAIHSLLEGVAIGVTDTVVELSILFIAVVAHKWAAGFSLAVKINKSAIPLRQGLIYYGLFILMTPLGILFATSLMVSTSYNPLIKPIFTALAAGTFIYIGTLHGLKRSIMVERCCNLKEFTWVIIGFTSMALAATLEIH